MVYYYYYYENLNLLQRYASEVTLLFLWVLWVELESCLHLCRVSSSNTGLIYVYIMLVTVRDEIKHTLGNPVLT